MELEPVEIEIKMKQNVAEESDKASKGVKNIGIASDAATKQMDAQIKQQLALINKISKALDDITKKSNLNASANVDAGKVDATIERVANLRTMLAEARKQLTDMSADTDKLNTVVSGLVGQYQAVEQAIRRMTSEGKAGTSEMSSIKEEQLGIADAIGATGTETEKVMSKISGVGLVSKSAFEETKRAVKEQSEVVKGLKMDLDNASKAYEKMTPGKEKNAAYNEMESVRKQYAGAVVDLDRLRIKQDEMQVSSKTLTVQMEYLRDKMAKLRVQGRENTVEYAKLEELYKRLAAVSATVHFEGKEDSGVQGMVQGVTGLAGVLTAGTGVMSLFNVKSEEMEKIQARLQGMIAITIGLQEAANLVNKQGAFYSQIFVKAKDMLSVANLRLATALGISTGAATALMAALTLGLSLAITGAVILLNKFSDSQAKAAESARQLGEKTNEGSYKALISLKNLQTQWISLGSDLKAKEQFVIDNADAFKSLGVEVNNAADAENVLVANKDAFVESIMAKARAAAAMDIAAEKYKAALEKMNKADSMPDKKRVLSQQSGGLTTSTKYEEIDNPFKAKAKASAQKEMDKVDADVKKLINTSISETEKANDILKKAGINTVDDIVSGSKAYWEQMQKNYKSTLDKMSTMEIGSKKWKTAKSGYDNATTNLKKFDINGNNKSEDTAAQKKAAAEDRLSKMSLDYESKIEAAKAASIKKGRDQRLAAAAADFEKQKAQLEKDLIDIEKLEKDTGQPATEQRKQNADLGAAVKQQYDTSVNVINAASEKALSDIFTDVNQNFQGELDRNLTSINSYYDDIILKATEEGATIEEIDSLNLSRDKETEKARRDARIKTIEFESEIEQRRLEISDKFYLFEAERQKDIVNVQKKAAEERLRILKEQYANTPTPELADDIKGATVSLDEFDEKLKNLDTSKLQEIASLAQSLAKLGSALSKTGGAIGEIGDAMSGISSSADDVLTAFSKTASTTDKISAGISGLATLYAMVADQIAANKQEQDEWNDALTEAAHRAAMARIELKAYQQSNIFGVENPYSKAIAGASQYATAMTEIRSASLAISGGNVQTGTKQVVSGGNIAMGLGAGAGVGAAIGTIFGPLGTAIGAGIGALVGAGVGAITKKTVPVFESLTEKYGKIYDSKTFELNPQIIADYEKLDDETKKLVDNWEEIKTAALEAQEQMRENFKDLAGDIGTSLSDSLVEAFRNGDVYDSIDDFKNYMTGTIEDIIAQMIFAQYFQGLLDDLQIKFGESFGENGDQNMIDDLQWFYDQFPGQLEGYKNAMTEQQRLLAEQGYDIFGSDSARTGTSKGISTASQESISELSGGVLAMRSALAEIRNMHKAELEGQRSMIASLFRIVENTEYCRYLETVDDSIRQMRNTIDDINTRGIKMKV